MLRYLIIISEGRHETVSSLSKAQQCKDRTALSTPPLALVPYHRVMRGGGDQTM